jgi:hypothetical protein
MMQDVAHYKRLDFVDHFGALTTVQHGEIDRFVSHPKCLAVLEAFVTDRVNFGRAAWFLTIEFPTLYVHATVYKRALKQASLSRSAAPRSSPYRSEQ